MSIDIQNKVAIVTGASAGIGKETALAFAKEKAIVILAARREEKLKELENEIHQFNGQSLIVKTDVSKQEDIENLVKTTMNKFGKIDILINNAGFGILASLEETSLQDMNDIVNTNLIGPFYLMKLVIPIMKKQGNGHIINVSSVIGRRGVGWNSAYCATKFGLIGMTESLRTELYNSSIHVSIVCPGLTATDFGLVIRDPGKRVKRNHWSSGVPASRVAQAIARCAKKPKREIYIRWIEWLLVKLNALIPGFVDYVISKYRR